MKRLVVASVIMLTVLSGTLLASHGNVGLGVQFGEPSGITAKFWLAGQSAIDLTVGWNLIVDYLGIQAGYLYHFPVPISGKGDLAPTSVLVASWECEQMTILTSQAVYLSDLSSFTHP